MHLSERPRRVVDRAEDERRDDDVEAGVLERELLGRGTHEPNGPRTTVQLALESAGHRLLRLGHDELLDRVSVQREVGTRAASDLEHTPSGALEQLYPPGTETRLLAAGHERVVPGREAPAPEA